MNPGPPDNCRRAYNLLEQGEKRNRKTGTTIVAGSVFLCSQEVKQ
jgi:hypothetical protein